ncbi:MAG: hypothetical protein O9340_02210 [Cyclobacteriaceae bacterium]|nr:hypothetical protein [Cyclobacteriaceae bacterium]
MFKILTILLLYFSHFCYSQSLDYTYNDSNDSTRIYYITLKPKGVIKGTVILLPSFGEKPEEVMVNWDFTKTAVDNGYLLIIPALGDRTFFYIDNKSQDILIDFIGEVFTKYEIKEEAFFIGGFSFGGTMALQYAKLTRKVDKPIFKPTAVFAIDPPLDIERLYNCMNVSKVKATNSITVQESTYITNRIENELNVNVNYPPNFFWNISPFSKSEIGQQSLRMLSNLPIRIYTEPDLNWYYENRNADIACLNFNDSFRMINWLKFYGNTNAELIWTSGKGYRISKNNQRHPHSWSIANSEELIKWLDSKQK